MCRAKPKSKYHNKTMKDSEKEFTRVVTENKSTIYTVCYLFSNDSLEVEDLFQEGLFNDNRYFSNSKPGPGEVEELLGGCSFRSWRVS